MKGMCIHYFGGIIPYLANIIATVSQSLFDYIGSLSPFSGIIPFYASSIAYVSSFSFK